MSTNKIQIREYRLEDTKALVNIFYNTVHQVNIWHYSLEQVNVWAPESSLNATKWTQKFERTKPFVAVVDEFIVGFAEFEPDGHIDCFYCHHDWVGQGVGSALMKAIYEKAKDWKVQCIFADVSITAKPFFKRQGFSVVKEQTVVKDGIEFVNYRMEKKLY